MAISNFKFDLIRYCTVFLLFISAFSYGQTVEPTPLDTGNLSQQFEYVKRISNTYNDFKVVRLTRLDKMWNNAIDSLNATRTNLRNSELKVRQQSITIDSLNSSLDETKVNLADVTEEKDNISLLGIDMAKQNYHGLMWTIVFVLLAMLGIAIFKFKESNKLTVKANKNYKEVFEEYEEFKKRTLEKERKLKRELQTELNRVEDLKRRIN